MANLTIVANIIANEDKIELVKSELLNLIEDTRKEAGCVSYDLHQDNENSAHFLFFENWKTRELWQEHMQSRHIEKFLDATEGAVQSFSVNEMTLIG